MNDNSVEIAKRVIRAALLQAEDQVELEWANVLSCGALGPAIGAGRERAGDKHPRRPGPSREAPELFYQGAEDWEVPA